MISRPSVTVRLNLTQAEFAYLPEYDDRAQIGWHHLLHMAYDFAGDPDYVDRELGGLPPTEPTLVLISRSADNPYIKVYPEA